MTYLQYTSGSARSPAGVVVSHQNVIANINGVAGTSGDDPAALEVTTVVSFPFFHDLGLVMERVFAAGDRASRRADEPARLLM